MAEDTYIVIVSMVSFLHPSMHTYLALFLQNFKIGQLTGLVILGI